MHLRKAVCARQDAGRKAEILFRAGAFQQRAVRYGRIRVRIFSVRKRLGGKQNMRVPRPCRML